MTGKENTNRKGARKGARTQPQPKPSAARRQAPAAQPTARDRGAPDEQAPATDAAERGAAGPAGAGLFSIGLPVVIEYATGLDPATLPPHRAKAVAAVRGMAICESLFWVVQQLGVVVGEDAWLYEGGELFAALDSLGAVGKAVAAGASDQAQYLEHAAERLRAGRE